MTRALVCPSEGVGLDGDNPEHIQWVFQRAHERAADYNITGVTYRLTQGEEYHTVTTCLAEMVKLSCYISFWLYILYSASNI